MNRIELLILLFIIATAIIFVLKSKWFDAKIDWLISKSANKTPDDIKQAKKEIEAEKKKLKKQLDFDAKNLHTRRHEIEKL